MLSLALAEGLYATVRFDSVNVSSASPVAQAVMANSPAILSTLLAFAGAFLLVLAPRLRFWSGRFLAMSRHHNFVVALLVQLSAYAVFVAVSERIFSGSDSNLAWIGLWLAVALVTLLALLIALAPVRFWARLVSRELSGGSVAAVAAIAAWTIGQGAQQFWQPLAEWTFWLVEQLLAPFYDDLIMTSERRILGTGRFLVRIAPECSGYEGVALVSVFAVLYLHLFRRELRFPQALLLLPFGIVVIWFMNALRVAVLVAIGSSWSPTIALGGFHSQAGWITFLTVSLGMVALAHHVRLFAPSELRSSEEIPPRQAVALDGPALLVPFLAMLGVGIVAAAFTDGLDWLYPAKILCVAAVLWRFRSAYARLRFEWTWPPVLIGSAVFVLWYALEPPPTVADLELRTAIATSAVPLAATWLVFRVVGSVLVVPLVEELAFRGYLMRRLVSSDVSIGGPLTFTWPSFLISSVAFGVMHGRWVAGICAGLAFAGAFYLRRQLGDAVVAHVVANLLIAIAVLGFGQWRFWV